MKPKIGLALGSGGAKGLAHIGVLKAFEKTDIDIDFIAGSSIGALIGAYYAAHPSLHKLEEFILSFDKRKGFMLFDPTLRGGLLKGNKIEKLISELLDEANFESLRIPYLAVATDINTAEKVVINSGDLAKAVRASISVPAVFQPVDFQKKVLADGGLSDPVPSDTVRKMGADIVIGVNVESGYFYTPVEKVPSLAGIPMHSVNILRHNLTLQSLKSADIVLTPDSPQTGLIGWDYFFDTKKAKAMIDAGETAAKKALPEIEKLIKDWEKEKKPKGIKKLFSFLRLGRF